MRLAPLYLVMGAPGAGKTALLPHLVDRAVGAVAMDMDELLERGALLGVAIAESTAAPIWPAYDRMWQRIVDIVRRAGHPVVLLRPTPSREELAGETGWHEPVHWALLDCPDRTRVDRLRNRGWAPDRIDEAVTDAAAVRPLISTVFRSDADLSSVAGDVLAWAHRTG